MCASHGFCGHSLIISLGTLQCLQPQTFEIPLEILHKGGRWEFRVGAHQIICDNLCIRRRGQKHQQRGGGPNKRATQHGSGFHDKRASAAQLIVAAKCGKSVQPAQSRTARKKSP